MRRTSARVLPLLLSALLSFSAAGCTPPEGHPPRQGSAQPSPQAFDGRQPATPLSYQHADWLEREGRDQMEKPEIVIEAMNLKDGDQVADIGAGTGFFSRRLARAVAPNGKVYAEEIQPQMLRLLEQHSAEEGIRNIVSVLGTDTDPRLPRGHFDWVLLVDVYHEFQDPQAMLAKIRACLKPGGRVALVEYRLEGDTAKQIPVAHRMSVEQVLKEWSPAGFELVETIETLPSQHLFLFTTHRGARASP